MTGWLQNSFKLTKQQKNIRITKIQMPETELLDWLRTCAQVQIQARASGSASTAIFKKWIQTSMRKQASPRVSVQR